MKRTRKMRMISTILIVMMCVGMIPTRVLAKTVDMPSGEDNICRIDLANLNSTDDYTVEATRIFY